MEIRLGILSFFINVGNQDNHLELNDYNLGRETLHTNPAFFQASLGWSKLNKNNHPDDGILGDVLPSQIIRPWKLTNDSLEKSLLDSIGFIHLQNAGPATFSCQWLLRALRFSKRSTKKRWFLRGRSTFFFHPWGPLCLTAFKLGPGIPSSTAGLSWSSNPAIAEKTL